MMRCVLYLKEPRKLKFFEAPFTRIDMPRRPILKKTAMLLCLTFALGSGVFAESVLFVYEEINDKSTPYIETFRDELKKAGFTVEETAAVDANAKNLASYDYILIHGMVMAFASTSPVRDWLKTKPELAGKKVSLFVTANRWFLKKFNKQITSLVDKQKPVLIDAVSTATKKLDDAAKKELVRAQVSHLK